MRTAAPLRGRITKNVVVDPNGCWIWQRYINDGGYGQIQVAGKNASAHRVSYTVFVGSIPDGLQIDHLCRVRACCNPAHLEAVTGQVNTLRGKTRAAENAGKTHCIHGHPLFGTNLKIVPAGRGCRTCAARMTAKSSRRLLRQISRDLSDGRHGTKRGYAVGCRCSLCQSLHPDVWAGPLRGPEDPRHGTTGYTNYKCRCETCRAAEAAKYQRRRARQKSESKTP